MVVIDKVWSFMEDEVMSKKGALSDIEKDIRKKFNRAVRELAENVAEKIEDAYEDTIQAFYDDPAFDGTNEPRFYNRGYNLFQGSSGYDMLYTPYNIQQFGDSYFTGIQVDSAHIPGSPYKAPKVWVFDRAFYQGIHGITQKEVRVKNRGTHRSAEVKIKAPKQMRPTPKALMDREFKHITSRKSLDDLWQSALKSSF